MKKVLFIFLGMTLLSAIPFTGYSQQVGIKVYDCNNIKVTVAQGNSPRAQSFSLEKMLAPDIWSQQQKVQSSLQTYYFKSLAKGTYRVTCLKEDLPKHTNSLVLSTTKDQSKMLLSDFVVIDACEELLQKNLPSKLTSNQIRIYPNPAIKFIRIDVKSEASENKPNLILYNGIGQKMKEERLNQRENTIDLSSFSPGVYFVSLVDDLGQLIHNEKLIINK